ncbi:hypothetical protein MUK42_22187 [Musa troglodytarum]|uniref:CBBY-like protein n=1 Tax=Musa troglodytarum TaxID=320322 RepID=A0A9E7GF10_9LILI|nr:hypothetical protein MUK42_22187 [Musa troglodytarum]
MKGDETPLLPHGSLDGSSSLFLSPAIPPSHRGRWPRPPSPDASFLAVPSPPRPSPGTMPPRTRLLLRRLRFPALPASAGAPSVSPPARTPNHPDFRPPVASPRPISKIRSRRRTSLFFSKSKAFQKLGLDCANWTEPIYADLIRKAAGDEERMLILFFNRIGWPSSLPTNEKEAFMKRVLHEKQKALEDFSTSSSLTLRPGVENFIDDALNEGVPVVLLIAYSKYGDKACRSIIEKLGQERLSKVKIVGKEEVKESLYGQLVLGKGVSSSLEELLAKEVQKAASMEKQRIAQDVASILKLSVDIDISSPESFENIIATLRAGAEYTGLPVDNCVLIAGSQSGVYGAERIGMPCVVIRSGATARAEFRSAKAVMDAFGGADLTISKLRRKNWS